MSSPSLDSLLDWWKRDPERAKCTLEQIVGLYLQTFPGRSMRLLLDLVRTKMESEFMKQARMMVELYLASLEEDRDRLLEEWVGDLDVEVLNCLIRIAAGLD